MYVRAFLKQSIYDEQRQARFAAACLNSVKAALKTIFMQAMGLLL